MSAQEQQRLQEDMRRLTRMLEKVVSQDAAFLERLAHEDELQILDMACGACNEAETLTDFFLQLKEPPGQVLEAASARLSGPTAAADQDKGKRRRRPKGKRKAKLTGMDVRAREIADARRRFPGKIDPQSGAEAEFEFLTGDASKLDAHKELPGEFDLIFIRHQNFWNGAKTWEEIYHKALEKLSPEGRLIITSYFDREHQEALDAFRGQGGDLIITERNAESRKLVTPGKSIDRHVAILKRPG